MSSVHIIGAGVSGLSAALTLARAGKQVVLYETAPQAGGRCRSYVDEVLGSTVDNGNHLLLGANRHATDYLKSIGTWESYFTPMRQFTMVDAISGQPWHCRPPHSFPGIPWMQWRHLIALLCARKSQTVDACVPSNSMIYHRLIAPLCIAALNTKPEEASARLLGRVIWKLVLGGKNAWVAYAPNRPLSECFIDPALTELQQRGTQLHFGCAIRRIDHTAKTVTALEMADRTVSLGEKDAVIIATSPSAAHRLLPEQVPQLETNPILNAHFLWPHATAGQTQPAIGVLNGLAEWIFLHDGRIATTTSAAHHCIHEADNVLAHRLWQEICTVLMLPDPPMPTYRIIREKRATFAATADQLNQLPLHLPFTNAQLAGDYLNPGMPATLDAAIASGKQAAQAVLRNY